jgi:hypothetical protein
VTLIVLLLWLGEKVRDTAVASHLASFAAKLRLESEARPGTLSDNDLAAGSTIGVLRNG